MYVYDLITYTILAKILITTLGWKNLKDNYYKEQTILYQFSTVFDSKQSNFQGLQKIFFKRKMGNYKLTGVTYPNTGFLKFLVDTSWWYVAWYFKISFTYGVSDTSFRSRTLFFLGPSCGFTPFWPFLSEGGDSVAKQTLRRNNTWSSVLIHLIFLLSLI